MQFSELKLRIENARDLDFGTLFNDCIELFKKVWVQGLVMLLLTMVMMIPLYLVMYLPLIAAGIIDPLLFEQGEGPSFALLFPFVLFGFAFAAFAVVVSFGMKAGFYRICKMKDLNETGSDDYFYFFKKPYLSKVIKISLVIYGISLVVTLLCVLPIIYFMFPITFGILLLTTLLCMFPIIYLMVPVALMNVIFAYNPDLSTSDIVKLGFKLGNKKWFLTFGLLLVTGIVAQFVGMLMCFIGVFITASFAYLPTYYIYKESIGFENSNEMHQIENE